MVCVGVWTAIHSPRCLGQSWRGEMVSVGTNGIRRVEIVQIGGGLGSNTRHSGSDRTTLRWFFHRHGRVC